MHEFAENSSERRLRIRGWCSTSLLDGQRRWSSEHWNPRCKDFDHESSRQLDRRSSHLRRQGRGLFFNNKASTRVANCANFSGISLGLQQNPNTRTTNQRWFQRARAYNITIRTWGLSRKAKQLAAIWAGPFATENQITACFQPGSKHGSKSVITSIASIDAIDS